MTTDEKLDLLLNKVSGIETDLSDVKHKVSGIETDLSDVKHKVTSVEMTIENEMQVNIMRVAEGHVDLSRNLAEVKRCIELLDGKMEVNDLFIRHHDSEIKKLKML